MLFDLFGFKYLVALVNRNHGVIMSSLENLKREVAETVASNKALMEALNNLRSDVETVKGQLADAVANGGDAATLQGLADQLDAAQTAAREALDQNGVSNPADPVPAPTEPAPTEPAPEQPTTTEPAPTEPAPTEPAPEQPTQTDDQAAGTGGQPAQGGATTTEEEPKPLI